MEDLWMTQGNEQPIRDKFDVPCHELVVHPNEIARECITNKFALCIYCAPDDTMDDVIWELVLQHSV